VAIIRDVRPTEVYNLAAQSHVQVSFQMPMYTAEVDGVGTLNLLEAIRLSGQAKTARFYQVGPGTYYSPRRRHAKRTFVFVVLRRLCVAPLHRVSSRALPPPSTRARA